VTTRRLTSPSVASGGPVPPPPPAATTCFGAALPVAERYAELLATTAVERGLIGPREADRVWDRHLLGCAALAELIPPGAVVVDAGSGAGLPGIPLAIARPDLQVRLVEPMQRRVDFLADVVAELGLSATVERARVEELPESSVELMTARAVAPLDRLLRLTLPVLRPGGILLALKGRRAVEELAAAADMLRSWPATTAEIATVGIDTTSATVVRVTRGRRRSAGGGRA
jgi:16S rRNA (guanine527-N7)-methyltransferase